MDEAERILKSKSTISRKVTFPTLFWEEFEEDCKHNFNNTYHLKMQFDHEFRKEFTNISALVMQDLVELKGQVFELRAELEALKLKELTESTGEDIKSSNTGSQRRESTRKTLG